MIDPGAFNNFNSLGVGGALLTALWLVLKYKPWKNNNDGGLRAIIREENEALMANIRQLMESRNMTVREKVTDPIIAAIEKSRHDMRNVVSEAIANAYRGARRKDG